MGRVVEARWRMWANGIIIVFIVIVSVIDIIVVITIVVMVMVMIFVLEVVVVVVVGRWWWWLLWLLFLLPLPRFSSCYSACYSYTVPVPVPVLSPVPVSVPLVLLLLVVAVLVLVSLLQFLLLLLLLLLLWSDQHRETGVVRRACAVCCQAVRKPPAVESAWPCGQDDISILVEVPSMHGGHSSPKRKQCALFDATQDNSSMTLSEGEAFFDLATCSQGQVSASKGLQLRLGRQGSCEKLELRTSPRRTTHLSDSMGLHSDSSDIASASAWCRLPLA